MFTKICRIGNDPELRYTPGNVAVVNLSLAYSYGQKGSDGKKPTQWLEASLWGKQAEALRPHLHKGDQVVVSVDDLHIETYKRKEGGEGFKLAGRVVAFDFAGGKRDGGEEGGQASALARSAPAKPADPAGKGGFDNFDDEIPFADPYKFTWRVQ